MKKVHKQLELCANIFTSRFVFKARTWGRQVLEEQEEALDKSTCRNVGLSIQPLFTGFFIQPLSCLCIKSCKRVLAEKLFYPWHSVSCRLPSHINKMNSMCTQSCISRGVVKLEKGLRLSFITWVLHQPYDVVVASQIAQCNIVTSLWKWLAPCDVPWWRHRWLKVGQLQSLCKAR